MQAFVLPETGIEVDEVVLPAARDFLGGGPDAQLDAALRILGKEKR